jgi:hypothetical protein
LGVRIWLLVPGHDGALHRVCDCLLFGGRPTAAACSASVDQRDSAPRLTLDAVLAAYLSGDVDVVSRSFGRSSDFPDRLRLNDPREFDRWLGSWDRRKALFLIEIARATAQVSPRFPRIVVDAGRRYVQTSGGGELATPRPPQIFSCGTGPRQACFRSSARRCTWRPTLARSLSVRARRWTRGSCWPAPSRWSGSVGTVAHRSSSLTSRLVS